MLCRELGLVFIPVRRAAGKSITQALKPFTDGSPEQFDFLNMGAMSADEYHGTWAEQKERVENEGLLVVSICRNPFTKLASAYWYSKQGQLFLGERVPFPEWFSRLPTREENEYWWIHSAARQVDYLMDQGELIASCIIRFESLQADWASLFTMLGKPAPVLPHVDDCTRPTPVPDLYRDHPEVVPLVVEKFACDFGLYGYGHEPTKGKGS